MTFGKRSALLLSLAAASTVLLGSVAYSLVPPKGGDAMLSKLATEALLLGVTRAGNRIVAVGEYGNIILSDDDGKTWRQAKKVPSTVTLTAVHFADEKNGWTVGHDTIILHTTDAGETWVKQYGGGESDNAFLSVFFKDAQNGWAIGAFNFTAQTSDGGKTWKESKTLMPPKASPAKPAAPAAPAEDFDPTTQKPAEPGADPFAAEGGDETHLNEMFAGPDANTIFVAAEAGAIYRSADAGNTWQKILTGYAGSFWNGLTAKDGTIYVSGMRGNVWRSTDKGLTWKKLDTAGADQSIGDAVQLADGSLVFVGLGGQVLYTPDGNKFTLTYRPDRRGLNAVILDGDDLLVFGEIGVSKQPTKPKPEEIEEPLPVDPPAGG